MSKYHQGLYLVDDNAIDTKNALNSWIERAYRQKLYSFPSGEYYIEYLSDHQDAHDYMEWISPEGAARWLLAREFSLPEDLAEYRDRKISLI